MRLKDTSGASHQSMRSPHDFDNEDDVKRLPATVLAMAKDHAAARTKVAGARGLVERRQRETMEILRDEFAGD